jgi:thioesterase-3
MKSVKEISIRGYHIDHFGHVNHGRYVELLEEARWQYLDDNNLIDAIHETGAIHVVSRLEVDYRYPARATDRLCFETWIKERSRYGFCMNQAAHKSSTGVKVLQAKVFNIFVDPFGKPKRVNQKILAAWPDLAEAAIKDS